MLIFTQPIEAKRSYEFDLNLIDFCLIAYNQHWGR